MSSRASLCVAPLRAQVAALADASRVLDATDLRGVAAVPGVDLALAFAVHNVVALRHCASSVSLETVAHYAAFFVAVPDVTAFVKAAIRSNPVELHGARIDEPTGALVFRDSPDNDAEWRELVMKSL